MTLAVSAIPYSGVAVLAYGWVYPDRDEADARSGSIRSRPHPGMENSMLTRPVALSGAAVLAASLGIAAPAYAATSPAAAGGGGAAPNCAPPSASVAFTRTLRGPAINGVIPTGTDTDTVVDNNSSPFNDCLTVSVSNVNLPNGTVLTAGVVGTPFTLTITLENGAGTSAPLSHGHASIAQEATEVFDGGFLTGTEILVGGTD